MSTGPSWYDVLGVDPAADSDEIRAAWRAAIADLDPSDRRFRSSNQAAEVLLDPASRAAYDASLAAPDPDSLDAPVAPPPVPGSAPAGTVAGPEPTPKPAKPPKSSKPAKPPKPPKSPREPSRLPRVPAWALLVAALLAALGVATATIGVVQAGEPVSDDGGAYVEQSAQEAQAAAVRAIVPVLSYDYRTLEEDAAAARSYLTSSYQEEKYDPLFEVIQENAPSTQTVVGAQVVDSGVVRTGEDRVDVLVFVDRPTTNKRTREPVVYKDQVTVTMERVDGQWLIDDLTTSPIQE